jgi:hypothetical protein
MNGESCAGLQNPPIHCVLRIFGESGRLGRSTAPIRVHLDRFFPYETLERCQCFAVRDRTASFPHAASGFRSTCFQVSSGGAIRQGPLCQGVVIPTATTHFLSIVQ